MKLAPIHISIKLVIYLCLDKNKNIQFCFLNHSCSTCNTNIKDNIELIFHSPWLLIEANYKHDSHAITIYDLPDTIDLNNERYYLLCGIYNKNDNHNISIFKINSQFYLIDDTCNEIKSIIPKRHKICSCMYFLGSSS